MIRASLRLSQRIFRKFLLGKPRKICIERRDSIRCALMQRLISQIGRSQRLSIVNSSSGVRV